MKKQIAALLAGVLVVFFTACSTPDFSPSAGASSAPKASGSRIVTDSTGRKVEIAETVNRIVCVNVGALRYTCYM